MKKSYKKLNAILLSAGFGTRLRPLTLTKPKCLMEINNKSLLELWINHLQKLKADSVLINTHYLDDQVKQFLYTKKFKNINIKEVYEEKLLGTAGTLICNREFFKDSIGLLIHTDNFTKENLNGLIKAHLNKPLHCLLTMLTFNTDDPKSCGILEIDHLGIVNNFHEKKENPPGNLANGAVYVFDYIFLEWIMKNCPNAKDFSTEILPKLMGKIYTWQVNGPYMDIGNLSAYSSAQKLY